MLIMLTVKSTLNYTSPVARLGGGTFLTLEEGLAILVQTDLGDDELGGEGKVYGMMENGWYDEEWNELC